MKSFMIALVYRLDLTVGIAITELGRLNATEVIGSQGDPIVNIDAG